MTVFNQIKGTLEQIGAANVFAFPGFISAEWPTREVAQVAADNMNKIGFTGTHVREVEGTFYSVWEQE